MQRPGFLNEGCVIFENILGPKKYPILNSINISDDKMGLTDWEYK